MRDQLPCRRERATSEDPFAVALMKGEMTVGHARDLAVASSRRCALQLLAHFLVSSLAAELTKVPWGMAALAHVESSAAVTWLASSDTT